MKRLFRWSLLGTLIAIVVFGTVLAVPPLQENLFQLSLLELRNDVEIVADRVFGGANRPEGWTGETDVTSESATLAGLYLDNELLADEIFGMRLRPRDWIGATTNNAEIVARNIRHDLELSADAFIGEDLRPEEWIGGPLLYRCSRSLMNTVYILDSEFDIRPNIPESVLDYCVVLEQEVEGNLIGQALQTPQLAESEVPQLILAVRGDLERLADEALGVNNRPIGWIDNVDVDSPTLAADINTDLEALTDIVLAPGQRPGGWIADAVQTTAIETYLNLRFNLELLTDIALDGTRPNGWQGDNQLQRCEPLLQSLVFLAQTSIGFSLENFETQGREYCAEVRTSVNNFIENPPPPPVNDLGTPIVVEETPDARYIAESEYAFAYMDVAATQYMGIMPGSTQFRAWYRNFNDSTMMFVSGADFALFVDRRWTSLSEEAFRTLPTLEGIRPLTYCNAGWCNGPGPTPTPTGSGPILQIITGSTPAPDPQNFAITPDAIFNDKILVTWNHIRINYLLQRPEVGAAQVSLEICQEPSQIVCEPVAVVFDTLTGQAVPVVSQFGGLNVFELPYGYSTNFILEGQTYVSTDVWLNDPTLLGG